MNQFTPNKSPKNYDPACGDLMTMAEQELTAFVGAVTDLFGSEQAEIAAEDWLHELTAVDIDPRNNDLPASTGQWRLLTLKVAARLASRANASFEALATH